MSKIPASCINSFSSQGACAITRPNSKRRSTRRLRLTSRHRCLPRNSSQRCSPLVEAAISAQDSTVLYELAPRIAGLPTKEQAIVTTMVKQGMKQASGFSQHAFHKLVKEAVQQQGKPHVRVTNKPDIVLSGDLEQDAEATLMALYTANTPPVIFIRLGKLSRYRITGEGRPFLGFLHEAILE